jgi:uncharacterized protein YabE (DUF348 family)/3D (Asp-Asp-Asp) domain-containing protein
MAKYKTIGKGTTRRALRVAALVLTCVIGASSAFSVAAFSRDFTVVDGEETYTVTTLSLDTASVLDRVGVALGADDEVVRDDEAGTITVLRAFPVTLSVDDESQQMIFTKGTVADALEKAGVALREEDAVYPGEDKTLTPGMQIRVTRGYHVTVTVDGGETDVTVPEGTTMAEALEEAGVTLGEFDVVSVDTATLVEEDCAVNIDRVVYREVTTKEVVPYKVVTKNTDQLLKGKTEIQTKGVNGERTVVTKEKLVNGEVAETEVLSNEVTTQPVDEVKLVGTKVETKKYSYARVDENGTLYDQNGNPVSYRSMLTGSCTAYTAPKGASTATGRPAKVGNIAVNPNIIPYGTRLYICSPDGRFVYGYAVAADTGGALMNGLGLADLYYDTVADCYAFGRRTMNIYILD